jgi:hypothetical protein
VSRSSAATLSRLARRRRAIRHLRAWMRRSLIPIPCAYLLLGIVLGVVAPAVDRGLDSHLLPGVGVTAARDI